MTPMNALTKAVDLCGGVTALAGKLGVGQSVVSMWLTRRSVPPSRCLAIEDATAGAVTRYDLRPDVFGDPPVTPDMHDQRRAQQEVA